MQEAISAMQEKLLLRAKKEAAAIEEETLKQRKIIIDGYIDQAEAKKPEILQRYQRKANFELMREKMHLELQESKYQLFVKQDLADQMTKAVRDYFYAQSEEEYITMLCHILNEALRERPEEKPMIIVPTNRYAYVSAFFSDPNQIKKANIGTVNEVFGDIFPIKSEPIQPGFILSYHYYDLNYECDKRLQFLQDDLEKEILDYLLPEERKGEADAQATP